MPQEEWCWALLFSLPMVLRGWGPGIVRNMHSFPVSSPCPLWAARLKSATQLLTAWVNFRCRAQDNRGAQFCSATVSEHTVRNKRGTQFCSATQSGHKQLKSPSGWASHTGEFLTKQLPANACNCQQAHGFSHSPTFQPVQRLSESGSDMAQLPPGRHLQVFPNTPISLVLAVHSPSRCVLPLWVSYFVSISPSDFQHPGPSWCLAALPALRAEGAGALTLLLVSFGRHQAGGTAALVPAQIPGTFSSQCNLLSVCFSMSSAIFFLQTSYKLGFHWLSTPFLKISARCSS